MIFMLVGNGLSSIALPSDNLDFPSSYVIDDNLKSVTETRVLGVVPEFPRHGG